MTHHNNFFSKCHSSYLTRPLKNEEAKHTEKNITKSLFIWFEKINWSEKKNHVGNVPQLLINAKTKRKIKHVKIGQSMYMSSTDVWNDTHIIYAVSNTIHVFKEAKFTEKDNLDFVQMIVTKEIILKEISVRQMYLTMPIKYHTFKLLKNCCQLKTTFRQKKLKDQDNLFTKDDMKMYYFETPRKLIILSIQ